MCGRSCQWSRLCILVAVVIHYWTCSRAVLSTSVYWHLQSAFLRQVCTDTLHCELPSRGVAKLNTNLTMFKLQTFSTDWKFIECFKCLVIKCEFVEKSLFYDWFHIVCTESQLLLITNRKSHTGFRLIPTMMTLSGVIAHYLRFLTEFDSFAGQLCHSGWRQTYNVRKILSAIYSLPLLAMTNPPCSSVSLR